MALSQNILLSTNPTSATGQTAFSLNNTVTVTSNPYQITASENPVVWQFQTSALTASNSFSELSFTVNALPIATDFITISADTQYLYPTYQLTAADIPAENEFYASGTTPTKTTSDVADSICFALNENFSFRQRFYAIRISNQVKIAPLQPGARYNFNFASSTTAITQDYSTDATNRYFGQTKKDFSIWADLYTGCSGFLNSAIDRAPSYKIGSTEITYIADNEYNFDVSNVIKSYLSTPLPQLGLTTFWRTTEDIANIYLVYGTKYDEFENNFKRRFIVGETEVVWVTNSSLPFTEVNNLVDYTVQAIPGGTQSKAFMTNQPSEKDTYTTSKEFLSFCFAHVLAAGVPTIDFYLKGEYELYDGTSVTFTNKKITTTASGGSFHVETSYGTMGFPSTPKVRRYWAQVWAHYTDDSLNEFNYKVVNRQDYNVIDECIYDYATQFIFKNEFGRWDTFFFNAEIEEELDRDADTFNSPAPYTPTSEDRLITNINIEASKILTAKSGWIDKQHFDWLFELAKSNDIRLISGTDFIPVNVNKKLDWKMDSTNTLYQVKMQYSFAKSENFVKQ